MSLPVVELRNVSRHFPSGDELVVAVDDVNLTMPKGDFVALVGPSGCGKSTLLNLVGCLDRPTSGELYLDGQATSKMSDDELAYMRNRKIGFVFQHYNLLPRLSALKNVELPMLYAGVPRPLRRQRAKEGLERVGLGHRLEHTPAQLSGGESQRVAVARALSLEPPLILADEPTGNLDTRTGEEIIRLFLDINAQGTTILMVTHDNRVLDIADRILQIEDGRLA